MLKQCLLSIISILILSTVIYGTGDIIVSKQIEAGGGYISLAINSTGGLHIAHYNGGMRYCQGEDIYSISCEQVTTKSEVDFSVAIDNNDKVHISGINISGVPRTLYICDNTAGSWVCEDNITYVGYGISAEMVIDSNNKRHILLENDTGDTPIYCEDTTGDWICKDFDKGHSGGEYVGIAILANNTPHFAIGNTAPRYGFYASETFYTEEIEDTDASEYPSIDFDSNNVSHISWRDYTLDTMRYCYGNYQNWNCETLLGADMYYTCLLVDKYDGIHIFAINNSQNLTWCRKKAGGSWDCDVSITATDVERSGDNKWCQMRQGRNYNGNRNYGDNIYLAFKNDTSNALVVMSITPGDDAPTYTANDSNTTSPTNNDWVLTYVNWTDDYELNYTWIGNNFTGTWSNETPTPRSGLTSVNHTNVSQITAGFDKKVCWRGYANDSSGNFNQTIEQCWTTPAESIPLPLEKGILNIGRQVLAIMNGALKIV